MVCSLYHPAGAAAVKLPAFGRVAMLRAPALWFVLLLAGAWWPSRFLGPLDGAPLDRPAEAILLGLVFPWLFWLGRDACRTRAFRVAIVLLIGWKAATFGTATQQGLCARVQAAQPVSGIAFAMQIDEPRGFLRSWDLRADLWADEPRCTAILTRPMATALDFPAWFVNITDQMIPRQPLTMTVRGVLTDSGGTRHAVDAIERLSGDGVWSFDPRLNGAPLWGSGLVTVVEPTRLDRALAPWAWLVAPALCVILTALLLRSAILPLVVSWSATAWVVLGSSAAIALASASQLWVQRLIGLLVLGAAVVRVPMPHRRLPAAAWVIGAPWLAFFAAWSAPTVGRLTAYSMDDWLAYQLAGYRIYMNGYWIEGGTPAFDFQALYRWITGALHLIFGDSSVGEIYWDASCLLAGALLAYRLARSRTGFSWGLAAAAMTLATLTLATPWYIIGRGLSEISAAGFAFAAMACLIRGRSGELRWAAVAAVMGAFAFFARQNHLLWVPFLVLLLLPDDVGSDLRGVRAALVRLPWKPVVAYLTGFVVALVAFMTRTWYFTGVFSLFHGTSLRHNDTGLRPWHFLDGVVWSKVGHSLAGLMFMNEPPHADARSLVVVAGVLVGLLATLQLSFSRSIPAGLLLAAIGSVVAAFLAHSHGYPGRFTVHLIPLASAITVIAAATPRRTVGTPLPAQRLR